MILFLKFFYLYPSIKIAITPLIVDQIKKFLCLELSTGQNFPTKKDETPKNAFICTIESGQSTPPLNHCLDFKNFSSKQTPLATFYGTDKSIFGCLNFFGWEILGLSTYKVG